MTPTHLELASEVGELVNVDSHEVEVALGAGHALENGSEDTARLAPVGIKVDKNGLVLGRVESALLEAL